MENNNQRMNQSAELTEIINIGLTGDRELDEIEKLLAEFSESNPNSTFELDVQPLDDQDRVNLQFKTGAWAVNYLLGSEVHVAVEIQGENQEGYQTHQIKPNQKFDISSIEY